MAVVDIPHDKLPEGIFVVTVYDENYYAFAERLCLIAFPEQLPLQIKTDRSEYGRREKVTVELDLEDSHSISPGNFSVAVVKSHLDDTHSRDNICSYFFLSNELKGKVENPYSYVNAPASIAIPNMDLLLLTQGWRRYSWDNVIKKEYPEITYFVEPGLTFSGKVHLENEKQKIEDIEVTAIFRHKELNDIQSFQPAEGGEFTFTNYDFRDTAEVIISAMYKKRRALDVSAKELLRARPGYYYYGGISEEEKGLKKAGAIIFYDSEKSINERIHELGEISVTARAKRLKTYNRYHIVLHEEAFVQHSYQVQKHQSYTVANPGEGIPGALGILHSVPGVVIGHGGAIRVAGSGGMSGPQNSMARRVDPVFILDGKRVTPAELVTIPSSHIKRVDVLNPASAMMYDSGAWGGAIVFHTRSWEGMVYGIPTKTLSYKFAGYNQTKEFFSPDYSPGTREYIDPDHRNTLYWQPNITINESGKVELSFFTSDYKGEYLIHCEGRTEDGEIGTGFSLIQIN